MFRVHLARKPRGRTIAVADVGSGSAGVAIVTTSSNGPVRIVASERSTLPFEERSLEATRAGVVAQLGEAAQKALATFSARRQGQIHVSSATAIIRAPWTRSKTIRAASELTGETRIEKHMIDALAQEALGADTEFDHEKILEASVMRVELNGYPTGVPVGKRAQHLAVSALLSDCDPNIRSGASETLSKTFSCPPPTLRSGTRALLSCLRESAFLVKDCLVVNMTSQGTSLFSVRKGVIAESIGLSEGSRSIVARIAGEKMPEETLTLIRMLALDQCEAEACETIKAALARAEPELVKVFGDAFVKMVAQRRLPNTLILSAHEDLLPWLVRFFSRIDFSQFTVTTRPFSPRAFTQLNLEGLVVLEKGITPDTGLCIAGALVNIEEHST